MTRSNESIYVFLDKLRMEHVLDFRKRLYLGSLTIPLTDPFLTKVQNARLAAKDMTDIIALLEDHAVADSDGQELLNSSCIAGLCSDDCGLWKSPTDNLYKVSKLVEHGSSPTTEKPELPAKLASIRETIGSRGKTPRWKLRTRVGERVQLYLDVEEVEQPNSTMGTLMDELTDQL
jgi:hypothetical protein